MEITDTAVTQDSNTAIRRTANFTTEKVSLGDVTIWEMIWSTPFPWIFAAFSIILLTDAVKQVFGL